MIRFTELSESLPYPPIVRGQLSTIHAKIINYAASNFMMTYRFRSQVVNAMNAASYIVISGDSLPDDWNLDDPLVNIPSFDDDLLKTQLNGLYLSEKNINWDLEEVDKAIIEIGSSTTHHQSDINDPHSIKPAKNLLSKLPVSSKQTSKESLYLKPPEFPQFDKNRIWCAMNDEYNQYIIYTSLPIIPSCQNEISVTTELMNMSDSDLLNLYPNCFIPTRFSGCYTKYDFLKYDDLLGTILPIEGFTEEQVIDNIIKYPHFYKLYRVVDSQIVSFYTQIEIEGKLHDTLAVWESLPESKLIPRNSDLIKEYVIRRYLLERDVLGIHHVFPLFGELDPYITLFMSPDSYIERGYKDLIDMAKCCVKSRIDYKRSRNPILRRLQEDVPVHV